MARFVIAGLVALSVAACGALAACGDGDQRAGEPPANLPRLEGTWQATGTVERSNAADQPPGTELERRWLFFRKCRSGRCALWLTRQSADVYEQAPVERTARGLRAVFTRSTIGCNTARTGTLDRVFEISPTADGRGLTARETGDGSYPGCTEDGSDGTVSSVLRWTIEKVSDECPTLTACRMTE